MAIGQPKTQSATRRHRHNNHGASAKSAALGNVASPISRLRFRMAVDEQSACPPPQAPSNNNLNEHGAQGVAGPSKSSTTFSANASGTSAQAPRYVKAVLRRTGGYGPNRNTQQGSSSNTNEKSAATTSQLPTTPFSVPTKTQFVSHAEECAHSMAEEVETCLKEETGIDSTSRATGTTALNQDPNGATRPSTPEPEPAFYYLGNDDVSSQPVIEALIQAVEASLAPDSSVGVTPAPNDTTTRPSTPEPEPVFYDLAAFATKPEDRDIGPSHTASGSQLHTASTSHGNSYAPPLDKFEFMDNSAVMDEAPPAPAPSCPPEYISTPWGSNNFGAPSTPDSVPTSDARTLDFQNYPATDGNTTVLDGGMGTSDQSIHTAGNWQSIPPCHAPSGFASQMHAPADPMPCIPGNSPELNDCSYSTAIEGSQIPMPNGIIPSIMAPGPSNYYGYHETYSGTTEGYRANTMAFQQPAYPVFDQTSSGQAQHFNFSVSSASLAHSQALVPEPFPTVQSQSYGFQNHLMWHSGAQGGQPHSAPISHTHASQPHTPIPHDLHASHLHQTFTNDIEVASMVPTRQRSAAPIAEPSSLVLSTQDDWAKDILALSRSETVSGAHLRLYDRPPAMAFTSAARRSSIVGKLKRDASESDSRLQRPFPQRPRTMVFRAPHADISTRPEPTPRVQTTPRPTSPVVRPKGRSRDTDTDDHDDLTPDSGPNKRRRVVQDSVTPRTRPTRPSASHLASKRSRQRSAAKPCTNLFEKLVEQVARWW